MSRSLIRPVLVLVVTAALTALGAAWACSPAAAATPPPWTVLPRPWTAVTLKDVAAFPPAGVAVLGAGDRVALSTDGGLTWEQRGPNVQGADLKIEGLDFADADRGVVVGDAGLLLVTEDGGLSWASPLIANGAPRSDLLAVDLAGRTGYAVGRSGTIVATADGGVSWTRVAPVTYADLTSVAVAPDGTAVAGAADGEILTEHGGGWQGAAPPAAPVLDVAASVAGAAPGWPACVANLGTGLLGSSDGTSFAWTVDGTGRAWSALAWIGRPDDALLLAGPGGSIDTVDAAGSPAAAVARADAGTADALAAATPGDQSVAYVLGSDGQVRRTLDAARGEIASLPDPTRKTVKAGTRVALGPTSVLIAAPGQVILDGRVPGQPWRTLRSFTWSSSSWELPARATVAATLNMSFRVRFVYGGRASVVSRTTRLLNVSPRLKPSRLTYSLRRGTVYRFRGKVSPKLSGEKVQLWTDRGGHWHKIGLGGTVRLSSSGTWTSRRFGTPLRESYHLQARIGSSARHAAGKSPIVTVKIR